MSKDAQRLVHFEHLVAKSAERHAEGRRTEQTVNAHAHVVRPFIGYQAPPVLSLDLDDRAGKGGHGGRANQPVRVPRRMFNNPLRIDFPGRKRVALAGRKPIKDPLMARGPHAP